MGKKGTMFYIETQLDRDSAVDIANDIMATREDLDELDWKSLSVNDLPKTTGSFCMSETVGTPQVDTLGLMDELTRMMMTAKGWMRYANANKLGLNDCELFFDDESTKISLKAHQYGRYKAFYIEVHVWCA